jgi:SAM-dependent methyltransferase
MNIKSRIKQLIHPLFGIFSPRALKTSNREKTPPESFQSCYVEAVLRKIKNGAPHASLGRNISDSSKKEAYETFKYLLSYNITPSEVVVDYGCGTLRVGRHFIKHLGAGNYIGMDLDERILNTGALLLADTEITSKKPILLTINENNLEQVAAKRPRFIFSRGVLHHVPPTELDQFFRNISYIGENAIILIEVKRGFTTEQISKRSWRYNPKDVINSAGAAALRLANDDQRWLKFCKKLSLTDQ